MMQRKTIVAIERECATLVNRYANRNDASDWEAVAALFAIDGRMSRPSAPDEWIVGRDAILAAFQTRTPRKTRHFCANIEIEVVDPDTARGESAMLLFVDAGPPKVGSFLDLFVRSAEGWRFAERRGILHFA